MIAIDTSSLIAFLQDDRGPDVPEVARAFQTKQAIIPPPVVTEILSDPELPEEIGRLVTELPDLGLKPQYWVRAGTLRAKLLSSGKKCRVADALIAQFCLDHGLALVTRDRDFRHFTRYCGLRLLGLAD